MSVMQSRISAARSCVAAAAAEAPDSRPWWVARMWICASVRKEEMGS